MLAKELIKMEEEEKKPEDLAQDEPKEPEQRNPLDLIDKANEAAERLEAANKEHARLLTIQEKAIIEKTLGGQATAGVKTISKEEKEIKNARKFLEGTGYEDDLFPELQN